VLSLCTLPAISVDRFLALLLGIRYRQVVTCKRVLLVVTCFWAMCIVFSATSFWTYKFLKYYSFMRGNLNLLLHQDLSRSLSSSSSNTRIQSPRATKRTRTIEHSAIQKTVSSALWAQLTLVTCYLPAGIVTALVTIKEMTAVLFLAWTFSLIFVFLNSTLNPILYCWKIREVRQTVIETVRQIIFWLSSQLHL